MEIQYLLYQKTFYLIKLNLEFHFINNYECDNFIFGYHFLKLFDFRKLKKELIKFIKLILIQFL